MSYKFAMKDKPENYTQQENARKEEHEKRYINLHFITPATTKANKINPINAKINKRTLPTFGNSSLSNFLIRRIYEEHLYRF